MNDICKKCGSMDIVEDPKNSSKVICLNCGNVFYSKFDRPELEEEDLSENTDEEELEVDEELMGEELGFF